MRTKKFSLTLTTAVATSLAACGPGNNADWDDGYTQYADRDTAVCVDQQTKLRVPDDRCRSGSGGSRAGWYYMGRNSAVPYYGEAVRGGTYNRPAGRTFYYAPKSTGMTKSSAISRGGLGSSSRSGFFSSGS